LKHDRQAHRGRRVSDLLALPLAYKFFQFVVFKKAAQIRFVQKYVEPFPGCRILDVGCGPANIVAYLPASIGEYVGFDMSSSYIESARQRWSNRVKCKFACRTVEDWTIDEPAYFDIVIAMGIVHHLDDDQANELFAKASRALKLHGTMITWDNVYVDGQHPVAKWLISKDRGRFVRQPEAYKTLGARHFAETQGDVIHDALRIPYTHFIMRCRR
jgi:SAM-dependent methyltransferase